MSRHGAGNRTTTDTIRKGETPERGVPEVARAATAAILEQPQDGPQGPADDAAPASNFVSTPQADAADDTARGQRVGRPTLDPDGDPSEVVSIRIPRSVFDAFCAHANRTGISMASAIREVVLRGSPQ